MQTLILCDSKYGRAVYANKDFKKGDFIIEWKGKIIKKNKRPKILKMEDDMYTQIAEELYMGPSNDFDDWIDHSCDPNSGLIFNSKKIFLIAIKDINKNEEITWDYSTTMYKEEYTFNCLCGNKNCRKIVKDFKYLPKNTQKKYIKLGIVPDFIIKNLNN
ncbi:MAG: SET domain-containing protein [Candidatus Woesearchaeota archaeon]